MYFLTLYTATKSSFTLLEITIGKTKYTADPHKTSVYRGLTSVHSGLTRVHSRQTSVHSGLTSVHSRQTSEHSGLAQGTWRNSHEACLPIGCMWGGMWTSPGNAVALQKRHGMVGQEKFCHVTQNPQKRQKSVITFFTRLLSPPRPPVRIICSSLDKPHDN